MLVFLNLKTENINYMIVAGINTEDTDEEISEEVIMGSSGDVYASRQNLYVVERDYYWGWRGGDEDETSTIHKFSLDPEDIEYLGDGEVPGHI